MGAMMMHGLEIVLSDDKETGEAARLELAEMRMLRFPWSKKSQGQD